MSQRKVCKRHPTGRTVLAVINIYARLLASFRPSPAVVSRGTAMYTAMYTAPREGAMRKIMRALMVGMAVATGPADWGGAHVSRRIT